ncbi:hypothetical protein BJV74DRAFT_864207 [Russula compacta]|nr:hypothetical protein BJV74DRAFT_864207 [Russula compacta]
MPTQWMTHNPQVDLQAQDRTHPIWQTKPVLIFRLVRQDHAACIREAPTRGARHRQRQIQGADRWRCQSW